MWFPYGVDHWSQVPIRRFKRADTTGIRRESTDQASFLKIQKQPYSERFAQWALLGACTLVFILFAPIYESDAAEPGPPVHECDRLAANPDDPGRVADGVVGEELQGPPAAAACKEALAAYPDEPRFKYQHGRALWALGKHSSAFQLFESAADQGYPAAIYAVGFYYGLGLGVDRDVHESIRRYRKAAALGHPRAQGLLAYAYVFGTGYGYAIEGGFEIDYELGFELAQASANRGNWIGQYVLGIIYFNGLGVPPDLDKAIPLIRSSAESQVSLALYALGFLYMEGKSVEQNFIKAREYLKAASDRNHLDSKYLLDILLDIGESGLKDMNAAIRRYEEASLETHSGTQTRLAQLYETGNGLGQDDATSIGLLTKAAASNYAPAQYLLSLAYFSGRGVQKDMKLGFEWIEKAAQHGMKKAQIVISNIYGHGIFVPKDPERAKYWRDRSLQAACGTGVGADC